MKRKVNIFTDIIMPLLVVAVTCVIFAIFAPEDSTPLYWFNMVYVGLLELLIFGHITLLSSQAGISMPVRLVFGTYALGYTVCALIWLLVYSIILRDSVPVKVYYSVAAVLTMLWIICSALTLKADHSEVESRADITDNRNSVDRLLRRGDALAAMVAERQKRDSDFAAAAPAFRRLTNAIQGLTPNVMADEENVATIRSICDRAEDMILNSNHNIDDAKRFCDMSVIKINSCKSYVRK